MKLFRFMSSKEFYKLIGGETLINYKNHQKKTNSKGFCFINYDEIEPEFAYEFLKGIVNSFVCVVFETNTELKDGFGVYADPYGNYFDKIIIHELSTCEYSLNNFTIVKVGFVKKGIFTTFDWKSGEYYNLDNDLKEYINWEKYEN